MTLIDDLDAERRSVEAMVSGLGPEAWELMTPAPGWTIKDQIWHLAYFDDAARRAIHEPEAFQDELDRADADIDAYRDEVEAKGRALPGAEVLDIWRQHQREFNTAVRGRDPKTRVPWYGVTMSLTSAVTARLMETWAHGVDIADTLDEAVTSSDRLAHVAFLTYRALPFSFEINGLSPPSDAVRLALEAPSGQTVSLGPEDAADTVTGPLLDFCLIATQRRHWTDGALSIEGPTAQAWIEVIQAFAGPPGDGRPPSGVQVP